MKLFHGTSAENADSILKTGLRPRSRKRSNWRSSYQVQSISSMVYLTKELNSARFHALHAAIVRKESSYAVIEAEPDVSKLYPDENFFLPESKHISKEEMMWAQSRVKKGRGYWKDALLLRGLVAHRGVISNVAVIEELPIEENPYYFLVKGNPVKEEFDRRFSWLISMNSHGYSLHEEDTFREFEVHDTHAIFRSSSIPYLMLQL